MVGDIGADNTSPNDDDLCLVFHELRFPFLIFD
jgi:hypothetical protein